MEEKIVMLVVLLVGTAVVPGEESERGSCDVKPGYRVDCGWFGIDEATCKSKGCCWDSSIEGKPYCYFTTDGVVPSCMTGPKPKKDCGWKEIDQKTCEKRTCCWAKPDDKSTPWCYVKDLGHIPYGMCRTAPSDRTDCGHVVITKEECMQNGCCYDDSFDDGQTPWCFYPPEEEQEYCHIQYGGGLCKYVCDPVKEPNFSYGLCSEGKVCCYKGFGR